MFRIWPIVHFKFEKEVKMHILTGKLIRPEENLDESEHEDSGEFSTYIYANNSCFKIKISVCKDFPEL